MHSLTNPRIICGARDVCRARSEQIKPERLSLMSGFKPLTRVNDALFTPEAAEAAAASPAEPGGLAPGRRGGTLYYQVTVRDNGCGMAHDDVPNMLGIVLSGTKYGVKQTRGKFGLGAKMALIWAKMSSGRPIEVLTCDRDGASEASFFRLDIDIAQNRPKVLASERRPNADGWRGTELTVLIEGTWQYRARIISYLRQLAIVTPYAQMSLDYVAERDSFRLEFSRRTDRMPRPAVEVKYHPSSVDLIVLRKLAEACAGHKTVVSFLASEFSSVSRALAKAMVSELGLALDTTMDALTSEHFSNLLQLFRTMTIPPPDGECLSPAGEYNLFLGIMKELRPELVATFACAPAVFEGHPFIVEAGVSIGGARAAPGVTIYRFANRIPLIFEPGNDVVTKTAQEIKWASYKIRSTVDKIGVFVSLVSTRIPFKGTGKEYVGAEASTIKDAVAKAIRGCCSQLKLKLSDRQAARSKAERKRKLQKYIPTVAKAISSVLVAAHDDVASDEASSDDDEHAAVQAARAKRRRLMSADVSDALARLANGTLGESQLASALAEHVERADLEEAFSHAAAKARAGAGERVAVRLVGLTSGEPCLLLSGAPAELRWTASAVRSSFGCA